MATITIRHNYPVYIAYQPDLATQHMMAQDDVTFTVPECFALKDDADIAALWAALIGKPERIVDVVIRTLQQYDPDLPEFQIV